MSNNTNPPRGAKWVELATLSLSSRVPKVNVSRLIGDHWSATYSAVSFWLTLEELGRLKVTLSIAVPDVPINSAGTKTSVPLKSEWA